MTRSDIRSDNPFSLRAVLALVIFGAAVFVALLWMIGAGLASGPADDGGNHAAGKGLTGFVALSTLLEAQGLDVRRSRSEAAFDQPGLLVLTPPHLAVAGEIEDAIDRHRRAGPTLLILPKWLAMPVPPQMRAGSADAGWVVLAGAREPMWGEDLSSLGPLDLRVEKAASRRAEWNGLERSGTLPEPGAVQTLSSGRIATLVRDARGNTLAGYLDDGSNAPDADREPVLHPVVVVAEPDLLNNYGFADRERAQLALRLVRAQMGGERLPVNFDLTLNGHARSANLLTLAFTPPFLAATICLLLAAVAIGWRAFLRFGPAAQPNRAIAFGKGALVGNAAGLIRRARRLHLIGAPYIDRTHDRLVQALGLRRHAERSATTEAIDRALAARAPDATPFSVIADRLRSARSSHEIVEAARELHALERKIVR